MNKITALTIATTLGATPTVGAVDSLNAYAGELDEKDSLLKNSLKNNKEGVEALSSLTGIVTTDSLNVRSTPDTTKASIGKLKKGTVIEILSQESNGWYKINFNGKVAYVSNKYVEIEKNVAPDYTVQSMNKKGEVVGVSSTIALNVRTAPNTDSSILYKLKNGTEITITGKVSNGWYRISKDGKEGFAHGKYIKEKESVTIGKVVNVASNDVLNVRASSSASAKLLYTLKNNTSVEVIEKLSNGWIKISYNGKAGYVNGKYIAVSNTETKPDTSTPNAPEGSVKYEVTNPINLRKTAAWSGEIIKVVNKGETLNVVSINGDWAKVYINGTYAYAPAMYLKVIEEVKPQEPVVPETPENNAPGIDNEPSNPQEPDKDEEKPTPDTSDKTEEDKEDNKTESDDEDAVEGIKYSVTADINMRTSASWSGDILKVIRTGATVNVVSVSGDWAKINENNVYGYVPYKYLQKIGTENNNGNSDNITNENVKYTDYGYTLSGYIAAQNQKTPSHSIEKLAGYINPDLGNKYEFLELNKFREISVSRLNTVLDNNDAGVLKNQGQAIYNAAKKYNIDPLYFVSQSIHETGYGKSTLAKGVTITEIANEDKPITDSKGNITGYEMIPLDKPTIVYNLYGIGAKDNLSTMPNRALVLGTTRAYNEGWTTVEKAIEGAAKFVSTNYINSSKYNQNTLYKIRYNPSKTYLWHQYATSPWYAREIAKLMEKFDSIYEPGNTFSYDKPRFIESKDNDEVAVILDIYDIDDVVSRIGKPDIVLQAPID